jgi:hypothetical protein
MDNIAVDPAVDPAATAVLLQITKNKKFFGKQNDYDYTVTVLAQNGVDTPKIAKKKLIELIADKNKKIFLNKNNESIMLDDTNMMIETKNVDIFTIIPTASVNTTIDIGTGLLHPTNTTGTTIGGKRKTKRKRTSYKKSARRKHRS